MIQIGNFNSLKVVKHVDFGVYLDGGEDGEILLPLRDMPRDCEIGDILNVFICFDSDDRLIATTQTPLAQVGQFACLEVVSLENVGAFLDWGLPKDLFLPFRERTRPVKVGQTVVVYIYIDNTDRICASMRLDKYVQAESEKQIVDFKENQAVELFIAARTDLGFKAIINGTHWGMLYNNEIFQPLEHGDRLSGFIKKIREDGKIDLSLQGAKNESPKDLGEKILALLKSEGGYLAINDKTPAEEIYQILGVSKKKYKIALGGLYKQRLISVHDDGIRLLKSIDS